MKNTKTTSDLMTTLRNTSTIKFSPIYTQNEYTIRYLNTYMGRLVCSHGLWIYVSQTDVNYFSMYLLKTLASRLLTLNKTI